MIYGGSDRSVAQKTVLMTLQTLIIAAGIWLLLFGGLEWVSRILDRDWGRAVLSRRVALVAGFVIVYLRMVFTIFSLLKRSMSWEEALSIPVAFALYYIGFSLFAGPVGRVFGAIDVVGVLLFVAGSLVNTLSEVLRDRWKRDPSNAGKLYTEGFFRYSMHINYFGDVVWVSGLALMTANPWSATVPVLLFCFFAFFNAPQLDRHLAGKYGAEFEAYRSKTKRIIPFIY